MINQCIFCGSFDNAMSADIDRCADCAKVFGDAKNAGSLGALSVSIGAAADDASPWPAAPMTTRGLHPPPLPNSSLGRQTQRIPIVKMERYAKKSEAMIPIAHPMDDGPLGRDLQVTEIPAALLGLSHPQDMATVRPQPVAAPLSARPVEANPIPLLRRRKSDSKRQVAVVALLAGVVFVGLGRVRSRTASADVVSGSFAVPVTQAEDPLGASPTMDLREGFAESARETVAKATEVQAANAEQANAVAAPRPNRPPHRPTAKGSPRLATGRVKPATRRRLISSSFSRSRRTRATCLPSSRSPTTPGVRATSTSRGAATRRSRRNIRPRSSRPRRSPERGRRKRPASERGGLDGVFQVMRARSAWRQAGPCQGSVTRASRSGWRPFGSASTSGRNARRDGARRRVPCRACAGPSCSSWRG